MVSKLMSFRAPVSSRKPSSFVTVSISSGGLIWPFGGQPVQQARHGNGVAAVGPAGAFDLHRVLRGAGQGAGVGSGHNRGARRLQSLEVEGGGLSGVDQHPLAAEFAQGGGQGVGRLQRHGVAEPGAQGLGLLGGVEKQARRAVAAQDRLRQRQG